MQSLITLLQIGGPVCAIAALVMWLGSRHMTALIDLVGNHMTHVEKAITRNTAAQETTATNIDRLVTRIDILLTRD